MRNWLMMMLVVVLAMTGISRAADVHVHDTDVSHGAAQMAHAEHDEIAGPHPTIPTKTTWAGAMVIIVIGMFVAAAAVGVVVRANAPDEEPATDAHHHDDAHGHGHDDPHHGASGHHH